MTKLKYEIWKSNQNNKEVHFFDGLTYVLGVNPQLIPLSEVIELLSDFNYEFPVEAGEAW